MSIGRHSCRVAIVKAIFAEEFREQNEKEVVEMILEGMKASLEEVEKVKKTLEGILKKKEEIWKVISEFAPERPVNEINPTNRAILMLGVWEIMFVSDEEVPPIVAINEAIEVAREMSDEAGIAFVNGVLNKVYENFQKQQYDTGT